MSISLICAIDERGAIGYKNNLLFKIPEDLQRFKEITLHNENNKRNFVLMGRKTFASLPKPLVGRINVVVTKNEKYKPDNPNNEEIIVVHNLENVINHYLSGKQTKDLHIIGGQTIYEQVIKYADKIYLTIIHDDTKPADTYFPMDELVDFKVVKTERHFSEKYGVEYSFVDLVRKEEVGET